MADLFSDLEDDKKISIGKTEVEYKTASSILTKASGFMETYDYTLNPYSGCSFGCTYCYAAFFSRTEEKRKNWGYWIQVKENALQLLMKFRKKSLHDKTICMSSVTDPYQPIKYFSLTALLLLISCSFLKQNDFIISKVISKNTNEQILYDVYQTGIDNYRFEFKAVNHPDTIKLFEYFLNDATYKAMRFKITPSNDTLTIVTNMPTDFKFSQTKIGTIVILKNE